MSIIFNMLVDIDIDKFNNNYLVKFTLDQFTEEVDYRMALTIIKCVAADMELEPELEVEDMKDIAGKTRELIKNAFTFEIGQEGIEVDIS